MNKVAKIVLIIVPTLFQKTVILRIFEQFNRICQSEKICCFNFQFRDILASLIPAVSSLPFSRAVWVDLDGVEILLVRITYVGEVLITTFAKLFNLIQKEGDDWNSTGRRGWVNAG